MNDDQTLADASDSISRRDMLLTTAASAVVWNQVSAAEPGKAKPFVVTPYIQLGDAPRASKDESLTVMWHASPQRGEWSVEFRSKGAANWSPAAKLTHSTIAVTGIAPHEVYQAVLHPLVPGVPAEYRVLLDRAAQFVASAPARAPANQAFRCVVMGDVGTGSEQQKRVAFQVHRSQPEFVLIPGDFVYNTGRISEYHSSFYPVYTAPKASPELGAPLLSSTCFLGGRGQHDTEASLKAHPDGHMFFQYWSFPLNGPALSADSPHVYPLGGTPEQERAYQEAAGSRFPRMASYSFDWGNSHWVVIDAWNPHIDWTDPQLRDWLQKDLASADKAKWRIVSSYMPPFSSCTRYPQGQKMRALAKLFEGAGVDIVFSGYAHSYQRTYPLRFHPDAPPTAPLGDPKLPVPGQFTFDTKYDGHKQTKPEGVLYVVSGCGGNQTLHSPVQTENPKTWQPYTVKYNASIHQFSQLDFDGRRLTVKQISLDGKELDEFTLTKPA